MIKRISILAMALLLAFSGAVGASAHHNDNHERGKGVAAGPPNAVEHCHAVGRTNDDGEQYYVVLYLPPVAGNKDGVHANNCDDVDDDQILGRGKLEPSAALIGRIY